MKVISVLFILGIVKKALSAEQNEQDAVINSPKGLQESMSTQAKFSNISLTLSGKIYSECKIDPWKYPLNESLRCQPDEEYVWTTNNREIDRKLDWAREGGIVRFKTDCWGEPENDDCGWISYCWLNNFASFPYHCNVYGNPGNPVNQSEIISNLSSSGLIQANCTYFDLKNSNGTTKEVSCKPLSNYTRISNHYRSFAEKVRFYNWTNGQSGYVFYTDCWGSTYNGSTQCSWVTKCLENNDSASGYKCNVYREVNMSIAENKNCTTSIQSSWNDRNWCANCSICHEKQPDGSTWNTTTCRPCRNYTFTTTDYSVHTRKIQNTDSSKGKEIVFESDCLPTTCYWCVKAIQSSYGFNYSPCEDTTRSNVTTNTFKHQLSFGIDWCANCTVNGTEFGGCRPCTNWAPYSNVTCKQNITRINNPGLSWCSNCTTCSNGFQICTPCLTTLGSVVPEDFSMTASDATETPEFEGNNRRGRNRSMKKHRRNRHGFGFRNDGFFRRSRNHMKSMREQISNEFDRLFKETPERNEKPSNSDPFDIVAEIEYQPGY